VNVLRAWLKEHPNPIADELLDVGYIQVFGAIAVTRRILGAHHNGLAMFISRISRRISKGPPVDRRDGSISGANIT